ncbi:MAG: hypothetical protein ACJ746_05040 [Bryobacteraceae bacterium]
MVESFARQAIHYTAQGDQAAVVEAQTNLETFCELAMDMIKKLKDQQNAAVLTARLRFIRSALEGSRNVA